MNHPETHKTSVTHTPEPHAAPVETAAATHAKLATFVFPDVTPAQVAALKSALKSNGSLLHSIPEDPSRMMLSGHGVTAAAVYTPHAPPADVAAGKPVAATGALTVTVNQKPFYVSMKRIEEGLRAELTLAADTAAEKAEEDKV